MSPVKPTAERFWPKVDRWDPDECWAWTGASVRRDSNGVGYGQVRLGADSGDRTVAAHRLAYEMLVGPIPAGLQLDHLCRNRACVNPKHLEPVTNRENILRGTAPTAANARKSRCVRGHVFSGVSKRGGRICAVCAREWMRQARKAKV